MRQAGRFLPEYQALKKEYSMHQLFYEKKLIKQITKMPLKRFDVDAAIIFSDILLPLEALGAKIILEHQKAPKVVRPKDITIDQLVPCQELFSFVYESIDELKKEISVPLIGFTGGPLTLLSYLFPEKKDNGEFYGLKKWHLENPEELNMILELITHIVIDHLKMQIQAGCEVVQIFDSWAGRFSKEMFEAYSLIPITKICQAIESLNVPVIYFSRNLGAHEKIFKAPCRGISIDQSMDFKGAFKYKKVIQGSFDPALLLTNKKIIDQEVSKVMGSYQSDRWIANLGHGVLPETPIENVEAFIEAIHNLPSSTWGHGT